MPELHIRLAMPQERDTLEALQRRASLALPEHRAALEAHPDAIHLPTEQIERGQVSVAELDGRIVAFAVLIAENEEAELDGLFVEPDLWRLGIGSNLVQAAVHEARRRGLSVTVIANLAAREFYEKCGFAVEGTAETRFGPALKMSR